LLRRNYSDYQLFVMWVPDDFAELVSVKALWAAATGPGGVLYWRLTAEYGADGEALGLHSQTPSYGSTTSGGQYVLNVQEPANPVSLGVLAQGDFLAIKCQRLGSALDTVGDVYLFGLLFTYVAE
jgi:hypothetical protein